MAKLTRERSWHSLPGPTRLSAAANTETDKNEKNAGKTTIRVLTFEVATYMCRLVRLWRCLHHHFIVKALRLEGVRKLVSNDNEYLLGLALAEFMESVRFLAAAVSVLGRKCTHIELQEFSLVFDDLIEKGKDPFGLEYTKRNKMDRKVSKMERFIAASVDLGQQMDRLAELEQSLKRARAMADGKQNLNSLPAFKQKVVQQRRNVKYLKCTSPWVRTYDYTVRLLARSLVTIVQRIIHVFGDESKSRKPTSSAFKGPFLECFAPAQDCSISVEARGINDRMSLAQCLLPPSHKLLHAPPSTLGADALAVHYANMIIHIEKLVASPCLIGPDARDDLYDMLPDSLRAAVRSNLGPATKNQAAAGGFLDPVLAAEWREGARRILGWLAPLAHNMQRWESERSFENKWLVPSPCLFLLQTLYFADRAKTEAAITELLVGLNYLWRFGRGCGRN